MRNVCPPVYKGVDNQFVLRYNDDRMNKKGYCKDALKLLKRKVVCGKDCPILSNCPRLIMEDATDQAIEQAIKAMMEVISEKN